MGTLAVSALIVNYRRILLDPTPGVTWLDAALLAMVNQAERAICSVKPEAYTIKGSISLISGTHQTIPAQGTAILDIYENVVGKRRVSQVNRSLLDASNRFWPNATTEVPVQHWTADPRDPTKFEVTPPNDGTGAVIALYGLTPPAIAAVGTAINLPDIYEMVIQAFVLAKAYAENTVRQDLTKASYYEQDWKSLIGLRTQSQISVAQKSPQPGGM